MPSSPYAYVRVPTSTTIAEFAASFQYSRTWYWMCILVHAIVVLIWGIMVVVWATKVEHRWTFNIDRLSFFASVMNFVTSATITVILGLATSTMTPLAMHHAFTKQQTLTVLHDRTSAYLGLGAAALTVHRNLNRQMPSHLLIILVYFAAALGVGSSFSPSFTLEAYNETIIFNSTLNSITTALTKTADHLDLSDTQAGTAFFLSSFETFPSLYTIDRISGIGVGVIYDALAGPLPFQSRTTVPAIALDVKCGEVPQNNWMIAGNLVSSGLNVTVSVTLSQHVLGMSGVLSTDTLSNQKNALYKYLDEVDPYTPPSRNFYVLVLSTTPDNLPLDSQNSAGYLFSQSFGPITGYAKVIGCSITASNTTVVVDGSNHAMNDSDVPPLPDSHRWSNATPLQSRGSPFEDSFSALYDNTVAIKIQNATSPIKGEIQFSLFEELLIETMSVQPTLQKLEIAIRNATAISYGALGQRYPYTNITDEMRQAGWDPKPTLGVTTSPVLRARLNLSGIFTFIGLGASMVLFATILMIVGWPSSIIGEELIGEPGLLPLLLRLRRSSLPGTLNILVDDQSARDPNRFRPSGARVNVYMSRDGQLEFAGLDLERQPRS